MAYLVWNYGSQRVWVMGMSRATTGNLAEVDRGVAGEAPRSAGWSHGASRDWGGAWRDEDGRDRVGRWTVVAGAADAAAAS
jgi:hypothetical protein